MAWIIKTFHFSLISDTLSVGGCWGQPMSFFWKLVDETQMSNPPEPAIHHYQIKLLVFLPLRAIYFYSLCYETPCRERENLCSMFQCCSCSKELVPFQTSKVLLSTKIYSRKSEEDDSRRNLNIFCITNWHYFVCFDDYNVGLSYRTFQKCPLLPF